MKLQILMNGINFVRKPVDEDSYNEATLRNRKP